jgi:subtilisin family serine protease
MNITNVYHSFMGYNHGNPIIVSVIDDGVDADHEDLQINMDLSRSRDAIDGQNGDPSPHDNSDTHGTMCAGIIGARAFNGKGVRGVAPFVKIAGNNWLSSPQTLEELEIAWLTGEGANEIAISSNSWGEGSSILQDRRFESILQLGTTTLRDGKGRIYVKASGNGREDSHCANLDYSLNNPYIITVSAISHENKFSSYSTSGANVLISGYAGHYYQNSPTIGTTTVAGEGGDTTWDEDNAKNYTFAMNGTSAATPGVAGALALVLEACPNLTYRDVKYLIAKSGKRVDTNNPSWVQNSAGLWHSNDYGYGLINAQKMIVMCKDANYTQLPLSKQYNATYTNTVEIPDDNLNGIDIMLDIPSSHIEYVSIILDINHTAPSELEITLTSPAGTKNKLLFFNSNISTANDYFVDGGRLSSSGFIDEDSQGTWTINISDQKTNITGSLKNAQLNIIGY